MMTLQECVVAHSAESTKAKQQAAEVLVELTAQATELLLACSMNDGRFLIRGDDGSIVDVQHFAAEVTGCFEKECVELAAIVLTTDISALTAIGNDHGFEHIFSRQVHAPGRAGDVLVDISTSGNSTNVTETTKAAHERDTRVIVLTGRDGGKIAVMSQDSDVLLNVPYPYIVRTRENHILLIRVICDCIDTMPLEGM